MKLPVPISRLVEKRSEERDTISLVNQIRDGVINQEVNVYVSLLGSAGGATDEIWLDEMPANSTGNFLLTVVGTKVSGTQYAAYMRRVVAIRSGTGAVGLTPTDVIGTDREFNAAADCGFGTDAARPGLIIAWVTGWTVDPVNWRAHIQGLVTPWE